MWDLRHVHVASRLGERCAKSHTDLIAQSSLRPQPHGATTTNASDREREGIFGGENDLLFFEACLHPGDEVEATRHQELKGSGFVLQQAPTATALKRC